MMMGGREGCIDGWAAAITLNINALGPRGHRRRPNVFAFLFFPFLLMFRAAQLPIGFTASE